MYLLTKETNGCEILTGQNGAWKVINPDRRILAAYYGRKNTPELIDRLEKIRDGRSDEIKMDVGWKKFLTSAPVAS